MKGVPSFNDEWFKDATKEEVTETYKGKIEFGQAIEHWKKLNPVRHRKPTDEKGK